VAAGTVSIKPLREQGGMRQAQQSLPLQQIQAALRAALVSETE